MRLAALGVDSLTDYTSTESDSDSGNEDGDRMILQVNRYIDDAVVTEHVVWENSDQSFMMSSLYDLKW